MAAKQLRTLSVYRKIIERYPRFRLVSPPLTAELARRIGFEDMPAEGDSVLPTVIGPATAFNAQGKEVVRRDMPKEALSRMIYTSWKDWHGQTHNGIQARDYEAYPRDLIPPPGEYLTAVRKGGDLVVASREISRDEPELDIVAIFNIFLEAVPEFEIVNPDLTEQTQVRKLSWKILPQGNYPFDRAKVALEEYLQRLTEDDRETAIERIRGITRHNPDFIAVGLGGFSDYVVFGFSGRRRYVLESPSTGNATYVFRDEWEPLSQLSKREILQGNFQEARLVHNSRWAIDVAAVINRP